MTQTEIGAKACALLAPAKRSVLMHYATTPEIAGNNPYRNEEDAMLTQIKYVDEYSVVRLPDGRIGALAQHTARKKPLVKFGDGTGAYVAASTEVEVLMWPAQLAGEWVQQYADRDALLGHAIRQLPVGDALVHLFEHQWAVLIEDGSKRVLAIDNAPDAALQIAKARDWTFEG